MLDRRTFLMALQFLLIAPYGVTAQTSARPARVVMLTPAAEDDPLTTSLVEVFHATLRQAGQLEGKTIQVDVRYLAGRIDQFPDVIAESIRRGVDVLAVWTPAGVVAAKKATTKIPIVFLAVPNPVETGIVSTLGRPQGNITGIAWSASPEDVAKELQLLREAIPSISTVAIMGSRDDPLAGETRRFTETAAKSMQIAPQWYTPANRADLDRDLEAIGRSRPHALVVAASGLAYVYRKVIIDFATQHRLPAAHQFREATIDGALLSFGPSLREITRRGAIYVDKILKGTNPEDLPIEQPNVYDLAINLKTARTLNVTVPKSLLVRADLVIE